MRETLTWYDTYLAAWAYYAVLWVLSLTYMAGDLRCYATDPVLEHSDSLD